MNEVYCELGSIKMFCSGLKSCGSTATHSSSLDRELLNFTTEVNLSPNISSLVPKSLLSEKEILP